jgi:anti-sigma regulatory factor (Ser/Thr protein kinase)
VEANRSFPAEASSPRAARRFVAGMLGDADDESTQMAMVLTSELVTNAVVHARTQVDVRVELDDGRMRVEVADGDPRMPRPVAYAADDLGGRGLYLVEQLASDWGSDRADGGKIVWFTLSTQRASSAELRAG